MSSVCRENSRGPSSIAFSNHCCRRCCCCYCCRPGKGLVFLGLLSGVRRGLDDFSVYLLVLRRLEGLLLLERNLVVELVVLGVELAALEVLDRALPDAAEGGGGVGGDAGPRGLCAEELDAGCLGGEVGVEDAGRSCNAAELADVAEGVVVEDLVGDERLGVEDHDGLRLEGAAVGDERGLREDVLLEGVAEAVVDGDLNLLDDEHDGGDILELILEVALAEDVVQVVLETVVDLVDDEDLVDLLDNLLLEAIVDNLEVLLLDLDDLLLLVEVVEAVDEVETVTLESIDDSAVEALTKDVRALGEPR